MTWTLVRHHPAMRAGSAKWMLIVLVSVSLWLGILANRVASGQADMSWPWLAQAWLVPAIYLVFGPHLARSREFALALPVPATRIWAAHVFVVLVTSGIMVAVSLGVITLSLWGLEAAAENPYRELAKVTAMFPRLWLQASAWWLLLAAAVLADQPGLARVPRTRAWVLRQLVLVAAAVAGLVILGNRGSATVAVPLILAAGLLVLAWRRRPRVYSLAPRRPLEPERPAGSVVPAGRPEWWRRAPNWLVVMLSCGKHPALQVILPPFLVGLGLMISNFFTAVVSDEYVGILMIPITAYSIFAVAGAPVRRLALFDYLPLSRQRLLSYLLVPQLVLIVGGYVGGELMAAVMPPAGEPISFGTEADDYGVRLWPRYFAVARDEVPPQTTPGGEVIQPPECCRVFGTSGPVVYKPYHTPIGASIDVCAWQLERASAQVFGEAIPAAVFKERYLVGTLEQVVDLREGGMELRRDFPELRPRGFPGVPPLQTLLIGLLFLATFGWFLTLFRPGRSERWQKGGFAIGLAVLMGLHMAPYLLAIAGVMKPDNLTIATLAFSDWLVSVAPGGVWGLWTVVILILAGAYRLVLAQFRRAEWPPVREDDAFCDGLG